MIHVHGIIANLVKQNYQNQYVICTTRKLGFLNRLLFRNAKHKCSFPHTFARTPTCICVLPFPKAFDTLRMINIPAFAN